MVEGVLDRLPSGCFVRWGIADRNVLRLLQRESDLWGGLGWTASIRASPPGPLEGLLGRSP
jgi:hypothetical protein